VFVTGLVLAAGGSSRLGEPKQLLPFRSRTLLDATLTRARSCGFDQLLVTVGEAADEIRERVDLTGADVVENPGFGAGCSSSIAAALRQVDKRAQGLVLLLGDQPGVAVATVQSLIAEGVHAPIAVCHYSDGTGHPFWFRRDTFDDLAALHGDKAVWKLLESGRYPGTRVAVAGPVPLDVDTREDYEALLARDGAEVAT
jgi:molybdenum cofactor cytidylyltransferase